MTQEGPECQPRKMSSFQNIIQEPQTRPGKSTYEVLTYAPLPNSHSKKTPSPLHPTEGRQELPEATGNQHHPMRRTGHSKNFKLYRVGWGRRKGGDCLVVQGFLLEWLKVLRTMTQVVVIHTVNDLNTTKLFTAMWLRLCYAQLKNMHLNKYKKGNWNKLPMDTKLDSSMGGRQPPRHWTESICLSTGVGNKV